MYFNFYTTFNYILSLNFFCNLPLLRMRLGLPVVALVGYTNAGKSTLLNRLSRAGVLAENMLFATLGENQSGSNKILEHSKYEIL